MTNPKHTDTSRSGDLVEREGMQILLPPASDVCGEYLAGWCEGQAYLIANYGTDEAFDSAIEAADRIEALEAEVERLRGALEAVWKEATTMRNASKLVGPYPKEPANNRVWARSMYHAGRKLHALIKPVRAALGENQ